MLWPLICLGDRLLCSEIHSVIWRSQPGHPLPPNAFNGLGHWYCTPHQQLFSWRWLLVLPQWRFVLWSILPVISTLLQSYARNIHHPPTLPCKPQICHIIGVLESLLSTAWKEPALTLWCSKLMARQRNTWMQLLLPSSAPSSCRVTRETLACVIGHCNLVPWHQAITRALFVPCIIPNSRHSLISPRTLLGQFMGSTQDTFHLPFPNGIFCFGSFWCVIPTRPTAHSFRSLYHLALQFYPAQHLSLITLVGQAINSRLMGIWFIPIVIRRVSLPLHFGPSKHQSWRRFGWYDNWICLWHLSTPTMMADPFPSFFPNSSIQAGYSPQ